MDPLRRIGTDKALPTPAIRRTRKEQDKRGGSRNFDEELGQAGAGEGDKTPSESAPPVEEPRPPAHEGDGVGAFIDVVG